MEGVVLVLRRLKAVAAFEVPLPKPPWWVRPVAWTVAAAAELAFCVFGLFFLFRFRQILNGLAGGAASLPWQVWIFPATIALYLTGMAVSFAYSAVRHASRAWRGAPDAPRGFDVQPVQNTGRSDASGATNGTDQVA